MQLKEIYKPIEKELEKVESRLRDTIGDSAMGSYTLKARGKRLRPALVLFASKLGNPNPKQAVELAASIELIHTATLIHDDVIDNAKTRRKQPSINVKFGKDTAILFGDYLYSKAFEIISALNIPKITIILLQTTNAICQGEMQQLRRIFQPVREKEYLKIISDKTASLFSACCETGGIVSGANPHQLSNLQRYGHNLGMIFQITDDCLDVEGDRREGKMTLPLIYLGRYPEKSENEAIGHALNAAGNYRIQALKAIDNFEKNKIKESLGNLVGYILSRIN